MAATNPPDTLTRFISALNADSSEQLRTLFQQDAVAVIALNAKLDDRGRRILREVWNYCRRWESEGGPHPEETRRERVRGAEDDIPQLWRMSPREPSYRTFVKRGLPDWNDQRTKYIRGSMVGVLEQLVQAAARSGKSARPKRASLDMLALAEAKKLQAEGVAWGPTEVAKRIGSSRSSLLGKRNDQPRCPEFIAFWSLVQLQRAERKLERDKRWRE